MADGKPGPRRSERARKAILSATVHELTLNGYDRFSLDRVSRAAGSSKQTIYRWYPSKSALIAECVLLGYISTPGLPLASGGSLEDDIRVWIRSFARYSSDPLFGAQLRAATAAAAESDTVAAEYDSAIVASTQHALVSRLQQGIADGQLPPGAPVDTLAQAIVGALLFRVLIRRPLDDGFSSELMMALFPRARVAGVDTVEGFYHRAVGPKAAAGSASRESAPCSVPAKSLPSSPTAS